MRSIEEINNKLQEFNRLYEKYESSRYPRNTQHRELLNIISLRANTLQPEELEAELIKYYNNMKTYMQYDGETWRAMKAKADEFYDRMYRTKNKEVHAEMEQIYKNEYEIFNRTREDIDFYTWDVLNYALGLSDELDYVLSGYDHDKEYDFPGQSLNGLTDMSMIEKELHAYQKTDEYKDATKKEQQVLRDNFVERAIKEHKHYNLNWLPQFYRPSWIDNNKVNMWFNENFGKDTVEQAPKFWAVKDEFIPLAVVVEKYYLDRKEHGDITSPARAYDILKEAFEYAENMLTEAFNNTKELLDNTFKDVDDETKELLNEAFSCAKKQYS